VARALATLTRGFRGALYGRPYFEDPELLGAYLLGIDPVSEAQVAAALRLGRVRGPGRVLDLGCGAGAAARAAQAAGFTQFTLCDASPAALRLASRSQDGAIAHEWRAGEPLPDGPFDLIVASHAVCEWFRDAPDRVEARAALLGDAASRLAPGGRLLVVEPARHDVNRALLGLRDALVARGFRVDAPCPEIARCPALAGGHACHASLRWAPSPELARVRHAAHLDRDTVAFGWLLLRPPGAPPSVRDAGALRVVSEPLRNKAGRVRVLTCGPEGRMAVSGPPAPRWWPERGEMVSIEGAERAENGWRRR
jgi:SAM-dependent methyltransferase